MTGSKSVSRLNVQIYLIKSKIVLVEQTAQTWVNSHVVEMIHCVYVATAVVDSPSQLQERKYNGV